MGDTPTALRAAINKSLRFENIQFSKITSDYVRKILKFDKRGQYKIHLFIDDLIIDIDILGEKIVRVNSSSNDGSSFYLGIGTVDEDTSELMLYINSAYNENLIMTIEVEYAFNKFSIINEARWPFY